MKISNWGLLKKVAKANREFIEFNSMKRRKLAQAAYLNLCYWVKEIRKQNPNFDFKGLY